MKPTFFEPTFFETKRALRQWLTRHHQSADELWVGMYKVGSGKKSITWPEVVDEALCFGWIDGVRQSIDAHSYANRVTPRRSGSIWSAKNIARVRELEREGLMQPAGRAAFEARLQHKSGVYSHEQAAPIELDEAAVRFMRRTTGAWAFFAAKAPWYQRAASHWVMTAKKPETKQKRLALLAQCSANGEDIPMLRRRLGAKR